MTKTLLLLIITMSLMLTSCSTTSLTTKRMNQVEIGMTKDDIKNLLGNPFFRNANEDVEEWGFLKYIDRLEDYEEMYFVVSFDCSGKVIAFNTVRGERFRRHGILKKTES